MSLFLVENNAPEPENVVNESGGAHQKYLKIEKAKELKAKKNIKKLKDLKDKPASKDYGIKGYIDGMLSRAENDYNKKKGHYEEIDRWRDRIKKSRKGDKGDYMFNPITNLKSKLGAGSYNIPKKRDEGIYKDLNDIKKHESVDLAFEYLNGCLKGLCEIDEELLEACVNIINENTDTLTVDGYNAIMESVEYLYEANIERLSKQLDKLNTKHTTNLEKLKTKKNSEKRIANATDKYNKKKSKLEDSLKRAKAEKASDEIIRKYKSEVRDPDDIKAEYEELKKRARAHDERMANFAKEDAEYQKKIAEEMRKLTEKNKDFTSRFKK